MKTRYCRASILEHHDHLDDGIIRGEAVIVELGEDAEICVFQGNKNSPGYYILKRLRKSEPVGIASISYSWTPWRSVSTDEIIEITLE